MKAHVATTRQDDLSGSAERTLDPTRLAPRSGFRRLLGSLVGAMAAVAVMASVAPAAAENRTLDLYNAHTKERLTITFKKNGRYVPSALSELNRFLRDWRRNEAINMDPRLFDTVWELYTTSGSRQPIHVVCGYRSLATNNMLRSRSKGVAEHSQHTLGKAMDMFIPDVSVAKLRQIGVKMQNGGVGYYPSANSPFVHIDVGSVRTWPRMTRTQLVALFPDGKTAHLPADGKPLPGYQQALAELKRDGRSARPAAIASASATGSSRKGSLLAMLFGDEEDSGEELASGALSTKGQVLSAAPAKPAAANARAVATQPVLPGIDDARKPAVVAPAAQEPVLVAEAPVPKRAPEPPVESLADATLPADAPAAPVVEVAAVEPPPAPRAKPEELIALASIEPVEAIVPRARPDVEEAVDLADATPVVSPDAAVEAQPTPVNAQMALAEVANDTSGQADVAALGYAPASAEEPAALKPAMPPLRTARLAPPLAGQGLASGQGDSLSPMVGGKADSLAALTAVPAPADLPIYDGASSAWWGSFARFAHPDQNDATALLVEPTTVIKARFSSAVYADMTATRFTGSALPRLQVMTFQPHRDLAMR